MCLPSNYAWRRWERAALQVHVSWLEIDMSAESCMLGNALTSLLASRTARLTQESTQSWANFAWKVILQAWGLSIRAVKVDQSISAFKIVTEENQMQIRNTVHNLTCLKLSSCDQCICIAQYCSLFQLCIKRFVHADRLTYPVVMTSASGKWKKGRSDAWRPLWSIVCCLCAFKVEIFFLV